MLGLLRSLYSQLHPKLPIRVNAIAPSWTETGIVPKEVIAALGEGNFQSADVVGRSVTLLMADKERHGHLVYSECGKFRDLESGERGFHALTKRMLDVEQGDEVPEVSVLKDLLQIREEMGKKNEAGVGELEKGIKEVATATD